MDTCDRMFSTGSYMRQNCTSVRHRGEREPFPHLEWTVSLPPDYCHSGDSKLHGLPGGLQRAKQVLQSLGRACLADAQVWGKALWEAGLLVAGRHGSLQYGLQGDERS